MTFYMVAGKIERTYETGYKAWEFKVLEVVSTEAASLEGMKAYAELGYKGLCRRVATASEFAAFSEGANDLVFDLRVA